MSPDAATRVQSRHIRFDSGARAGIGGVTHWVGRSDPRLRVLCWWIDVGCDCDDHGGRQSSMTRIVGIDDRSSPQLPLLAEPSHTAHETYAATDAILGRDHLEWRDAIELCGAALAVSDLEETRFPTAYVARPGHHRCCGTSAFHSPRVDPVLA